MVGLCLLSFEEVTSENVSSPHKTVSACPYMLNQPSPQDRWYRAAMGNLKMEKKINIFQCLYLKEKAVYFLSYKMEVNKILAGDAD